MTEKKERKIRIWVDGCFDMMHFGHSNALRKAKQLGDYLIVGVHSDKEIEKVKGPTVMKERERYESVRACKWVDEVVEDAPYTTQVDVLKKYNVDFCVHGDDMSVDENGNDTYQAVKDAGLMKIIKRTEGVSSTDIVNRMLSTIRGDKESKDGAFQELRRSLPISTKIVQFASPIRKPKKDDKVVFVDGGFDLFHIGHIEFLKLARKFGTYLVVGLHNDEVLTKLKGTGYPIMNLYERCLSVLSCRYVDEVIIGSPYEVTEDTIKLMKIDVVVRGTVEDKVLENKEPYKVPKELKILKQVKSPLPDLTTHGIVDRILKNKKEFEKRNEKKFKNNKNKNM